MAREIVGPSVTKTSQVDALLQLQATIARQDPGTIVESFDEKDGHWVASIVEPPRRTLKPRQAGPPPFADDGENESAEKPPFGGGDESEGDGPPSDDSGEDGPPKDGDEKKPGKGEELVQILDIVKAIAEAAGIPIPGELGPAGDEPPLLDEPGPPKAGPLDGPGPGGPKGPVEKPLKPGDIPPGVTPPGSPAFASYNGKNYPDPFPGDIGQKRSFTVEETENPGRSIVVAAAELNPAVIPFGYWVESVKPVHVASTGERKLIAQVTFAGSVEEAAREANFDLTKL